MGERLTDSLDRGWTPGSPIGRGTWGRSRVIRDDQGREAVLKEPLTDADFPADSPLPEDLVASCRRTADELARVYHEARQPFLPRLEATIDLGGGRTGLVLPRYVTLQRRLESGLPLHEALKIVARVATQLAEAATVHGDLRPTNILFGERGEVFLADPWASTVGPHAVRLVDQADARDWLPPEAGATKGAPNAGWDTWALCQVLHAAALLQPAGDGRTSKISVSSSSEGTFELTREGLDKVSVSALKDRAHARLATEGSNPRFRGRVAERLGALLGRGLSRDHEPSPPFRFSSARELADRVNEVLALVRPKVVDVGRILLPGTAPDGVFSTASSAGSSGGADITFSVTVGCTPGITDSDDVVCGLQLNDLDLGDKGRRPIEDARVSVQVHPSGRLRFAIGLGLIPPGRYRLRVAFAIKDSGDEPVVAVGEFQVRPPPGWVPPPPVLPTGGAALPFTGSFAAVAPPGRGADEPLTDPGSDEGDPPSTDGGEVIVGSFPRPVAPPEQDEEPEPPSDPETAPLVELKEARPSNPPSRDDDGEDELSEGTDGHEVVQFPTAAAPPPPMIAAPALIARPTVGTPSLRALPDPQLEDDGLDTEELLADTDAIDKMLGPSRTSGEGAEPDLPRADGDDLPGFGGVAGRGLPGPIASALELVRRDRYLSIGAAVAASLALILTVTLLLKAC